MKNYNSSKQIEDETVIMFLVGFFCSIKIKSNKKAVQFFRGFFLQQNNMSIRKKVFMIAISSDPLKNFGQRGINAARASFPYKVFFNVHLKYLLCWMFLHILCVLSSTLECFRAYSSFRLSSFCERAKSCRNLIDLAVRMRQLKGCGKKKKKKERKV